MTQKYLAFLALSALLFRSAAAQQGRSGFQITRIEPRLERSPEYAISGTPQRRGAGKNWLIIDVEFEWKPQGRAAGAYVDDLTFDYYIALNNRAAGFPTETLLVGSVTHYAVPAGDGMHSGAFIAPRTLERYFNGKMPPNGPAAVAAVGVTITHQGEMVAEKSWGRGMGRPQWWNNGFQPTHGFILNKNETPFLPLYWDYYESIRSKAP